MDRGKCGSTTEIQRCGLDLGLPPVTAPQRQFHERVLRESSRLTWRRGCSGSVGVQAVATLVKLSVEETYGFRSRADPRTSLVAELVDEPTTEKEVSMLDSLPEDESQFYAEEKNLLLPGSRSQQLFQ